MFVSIILSLLLFTPSLWADLYKDLDSRLKKAVHKGELVGIGASVVYPGKPIFIKAYGVRKKGEKAVVDVNTTFQLGSLSKPITATLVAIAQKKQKMSLKSKQVAEILSHTTGYRRYGWNQKIESGWGRKQLLEKLLVSDKKAFAGKYDYHNVAFSQIEDVIEQALKIPYATAIREYVFAPLKMTRATVGFDDFFNQHNRAWPHQKSKNQWQPCPDYSHNYHETVLSAAGMNASTADMAQFLQLQLGQFPDVAAQTDLAPFFSAQSAAPEALSWFKDVPHRHLKSYYGYGWRLVDIDGERVVFHGGWLRGFQSFLAFSPKHKIGIVILSNVESILVLTTAIQFLQKAFARLPQSKSSMAH